MKYQHVLRAIYDQPWAILPAPFDTIMDVVMMRAEGVAFSDEEIQARLDAAERGPRRGRKNGMVAVLPVYGIISQRVNLMSQMSGGTSLEQLTAQFREVMADPEIAAVVLDFDSPGGAVDGVTEFAAEVRAARGGDKPIVAVANTMMASAAYWIAAQADEVVVTPSGTVGSVGIVGGHIDDSGAREQAGIKRTLVATSQAKLDGFGGDPISEEGLEDLMTKVRGMEALFHADLSAGRKVPVETVRSSFGDGRMFLAKEAVAAGLADRVGTLDATVRRLARGGPAPVPSAGLTGVTNDEIVSLVAGMPFGPKLELVAAEVAAIAEHARNRAEMRAEEGRGLSEATTEQLGLLLALRPALDSIEAVLGEPEPEPLPEPEPAPRRNVRLELIEAALRGGYSLTD
jgi:signal peptide peptidase SppA